MRVLLAPDENWVGSPLVLSLTADTDAEMIDLDKLADALLTMAGRDGWPAACEFVAAQCQTAVELRAMASDIVPAEYVVGRAVEPAA